MGSIQFVKIGNGQNSYYLFSILKQYILTFMFSDFLFRTLQCLKTKFAHENVKKSPKKEGYFGRISVIIEIFPYWPMARTHVLKYGL